MGVPELREPGSESYVCSEKDLRIYRNTVLESGKDTGNKRQSTAFVELFDKENAVVLAGVMSIVHGYL